MKKNIILFTITILSIFLVAYAGPHNTNNVDSIQSLQVHEIPAQASISDSQSPTSTPNTYRIGDTGPAGGLIFYDKGNNSGGWRYLEAAPLEAEFQAIWSVRSTSVRDTRTEIGSGLRNTQLIIETFRQTAGEWDTAAQIVDELVFNGFDDWFLPSRDELDQMYGQLRRRNLGDFRDDWYWTSSNIDSRRAHTQNFQNGQLAGNYGTEAGEKNRDRLNVRPIRQVAGPN